MSGIQLRQQNLANRIRNILYEFNIDTDLLEIELTESALVDTHDGSFAVLEQINSMGLRVSMDDFGCGYSSLSCLRDIPLSCIKIDRSFVSDINKDNNSDKLIASIISIAHGLGLEVVAEGVEKKHQADHLTAIGCVNICKAFISVVRCLRGRLRTFYKNNRWRWQVDQLVSTKKAGSASENGKYFNLCPFFAPQLVRLTKKGCTNRVAL